MPTGAKKPLLTRPYIFKVFDVSTGHMTVKDAQQLGDGSDTTCCIAYELSEYGWLVYIDTGNSSYGKGMSSAFKKILKIAGELGCEYVRFNRDGAVYPELKSFVW